MHFPDPICNDIFIRALVEEMYFKLFHVEMESLRQEFKKRKDSAMDDVLGPDGLYEYVSELYAKVDCESLGWVYIFLLSVVMNAWF
jgi:hypothetical protein